MKLRDLYRAARSLEAVENYARSDDSLLQESIALDDRCDGEVDFYYDDDFWKWKLVGFSSKAKWESQSNTSLEFFGFAVSEWVARVPGLFWTEGAEKLRMLGDHAVQYESPKWTTLHPPGKSAKVLGGVGTIKLPENDRGYRLVSLSAGHTLRVEYLR